MVRRPENKLETDSEKTGHYKLRFEEERVYGVPPPDTGRGNWICKAIKLRRFVAGGVAEGRL